LVPAAQLLLLVLLAATTVQIHLFLQLPRLSAVAVVAALMVLPVHLEQVPTADQVVVVHTELEQVVQALPGKAITVAHKLVVLLNTVAVEVAVLALQAATDPHQQAVPEVLAFKVLYQVLLPITLVGEAVVHIHLLQLVV